MENLIPQCQLYGHQYEEIKQQFYAFHGAISLQHLNRKIPSLSIQHIRPDNRFYVEFLGKEYLIHYEFDTRDNDAGTGLFVSYLTDPTSRDGSIIPQPIKQLEVDRLGNARLKGYTDGYPWHCDTDGLSILLTLLI